MKGVTKAFFAFTITATEQFITTMVAIKTALLWSVPNMRLHEIGAITLIAVFVVFGVSRQVSVAQLSTRICGDRADVVGPLIGKYGETPAFIGVHEYGQVVELFVSPQGNYTFVLTYPDGRSCMIGQGSSGQFDLEVIRRLFPEARLGVPPNAPIN